MKLKYLFFFLIFSFSSSSIADEIQDNNLLQDNKFLIGTIDALYIPGDRIFSQEIRVFIINTGRNCEGLSCYDTYDFALELTFGKLTDEQIPVRLLQIPFHYFSDANDDFLSAPWEIIDVISKYLEWHQVALENEVVDYSKTIESIDIDTAAILRFGSWKDNQIPRRSYSFVVSLEIGESNPMFYLQIDGVTFNTEPDSMYLTDQDFITTYFLPHKSVLELNKILNEDYLISQLKQFKNRGKDLDKLFN